MPIILCLHVDCMIIASIIILKTHFLYKQVENAPLRQVVAEKDLKILWGFFFWLKLLYALKYWFFILKMR